MDTRDWGLGASKDRTYKQFTTLDSFLSMPPAQYSASHVPRTFALPPFAFSKYTFEFSTYIYG